MTTEQKNTLIRAINHFGVEHQIDKAIEEMGELITELARRHTPREDKDRIALEVADVLITANQLRIIFGAESVDQKIEQQLQRLEDEINGDWRLQERMMPKGMVVHLDFERHLKETQDRPDAKEIRRCCLFCKHIRASVRDPFCGITLRDILGNPRLMSCGRFEPNDC